MYILKNGLKHLHTYNKDIPIYGATTHIEKNARRHTIGEYTPLQKCKYVHSATSEGQTFSQNIRTSEYENICTKRGSTYTHGSEVVGQLEGFIDDRSKLLNS